MYVPSVSFSRCEAAIVSGRTDDVEASQRGHARTVTARDYNGQPVDAFDQVLPLQQGSWCTESAQVVDATASGPQQYYGFDTWYHTRQVQKRADDDFVVTDSLLWPANQSTAQRSYAVHDVGNQAIDLSMDPWTVNLQNIHLKGMIAGKMRAEMQAVDSTMPQLLQQVTQ